MMRGMFRPLGWLMTTYRALIRLLGALWFVLRQPRLAPRAIVIDTGARYDDDGLPVVVLRGSIVDPRICTASRPGFGRIAR
jgi:hypothetical protein